jgi:GrpB-like predicted nucleotidyltransferase (UPF0157 family)
LTPVDEESLRAVTVGEITATKRALSTREWRYVRDYADAKTEVVEEILAKALS